MTGNETSPIVKFRVDSDVQAILDEIKAQGANISEFIRDSIKNYTSDKSENQLVMKFCKLFEESTAFIPEETRNAFTNELTDQEEQRIREVLTGGNT